MLKVVLVSISLLGAMITAAAGAVADDWLELWTRCRLSIEDAVPINSSGLIDLGLTTESRPSQIIDGTMVSPELHFQQKRWSDPKSGFIVVEQELLEKADRVRRSCDVELSPDGNGLRIDERRSIVELFVSERDRLIAEGNHVVRDPSKIADVALGVGPVVVNANGCVVISAIMMSLSESAKGKIDFISVNGEQASVCGGPSLLTSK